MKKAFTLIEILIVVSILGILSAIVFPEFQAHAQQSREAAAKDNLRILRNTIEVYAGQHNDVPPGYRFHDINDVCGYMYFGRQLTEFENHLSAIPENPFSKIVPVKVIDNSTAFPAGPVNTELYGWIYKPFTKEIRLNQDGTDSEGIAYFDY